jgi:hypothetical protein
MRAFTETLLGVTAIGLITWHAMTHNWIAELCLLGWLGTWVAWAWDTLHREKETPTCETVIRDRVITMGSDKYTVSLQVKKLPVRAKLSGWV